MPQPLNVTLPDAPTRPAKLVKLQDQLRAQRAECAALEARRKTLCQEMYNYNSRSTPVPHPLRNELEAVERRIETLKAGRLRDAHAAVEKAQKNFAPSVEKFVTGEAKKIVDQIRGLADQAELIALQIARLEDLAAQADTGLPFYLNDALRTLNGLPRHLRIACRGAGE